MKKSYVGLIVAFLFCISLQKTHGQSPALISGTIINHIKDSKASLMSAGNENTILAESPIDTNGNFSLQININQADIYKLQIGGGQYVSLIIEPDDQIVLETDIKNLLPSLKISGSEHTLLIYKGEDIFQYFRRQLDSLNIIYQATVQRNPGDPALQSIIEQYRKIESVQYDSASSFITEHAESLASLFFIDRLSIDSYVETYKHLDEKLYGKYPENMFVKAFHDRIGNALKLAVGNEAPEISLEDPEGNIIKLSSLRGKTVLIDFWASWCGPCRKESPNMVKLYKAHQDQGFEIYSVSLDKSKDSWVKAIEDDGLNWIHVSDLKFWQCEGARTYNVSSVPYTVLLDKEGKIIAKGLRGAELEKKVAEVLDQK